MDAEDVHPQLAYLKKVEHPIAVNANAEMAGMTARGDGVVHIITRISRDDRPVKNARHDVESRPKTL